MLTDLTVAEIESALADWEEHTPQSYIPANIYPKRPNGTTDYGATPRPGTEADRVHYTSSFEGWHGWDDKFDQSDAAPVDLSIDGVQVTVKRVGDSHTGHEGGGEDTEMVFEISDATTTRFFRMTGYYSSYGDGTRWDGGFYEVTPRKKEITVFDVVK